MSEKSEIQKLVILGSGFFAEEIADLVSKIEGYQLAGFVEGMDPKKCHHSLMGLPVIWIDEVAHLEKFYRGVCAVGATARKKFIQQALSFGLKFTTIVHPTSYVSSTVLLDEGTIVNAGSILAAQTKIGRHTIINRGCLIGHHSEIGSYVTISPGANIAGRVKIGECCYVGMGAIILDGLSIGSGSIVGAGAVVTRDVPDCVQVVGIPARVVKTIN